MVASHEIPFMVAAYQHGIRNYDVEKAFKAMLHCQTTPGQEHPGEGFVGNMQLTTYLKYGYIPIGKGRASNALEIAYDDWCVAQIAKAMGRQNEYEQFSKRSEYWRNLFDKETGFMRARHPDGRWQENFNPYSGAGGWTEGNSWQYTWFVPQNVSGLVEAMGREQFVERLNEGLAKSSVHNFNAPGDNMTLVPINHGNQPSMQVAYLFNYAQKPWLTQKWARAIMDQYYGSEPTDGWPGDEDQGQGGGWFVMSALGLFQTDGGCRVNPIYEIGSPLFDRAVIQLDTDYYKGKQFVIEARNNGPENVYIQSAKLNGKPLNKPWFYVKEALNGGHLILEMGPQPNKSWGARAEDAPPKP
jgi:predicted alpha-1,2-mannosidase